MSRFAQIKDATTHPELIDLYKDVTDNGFGRETPVNWFTSQAERPDLLACTWSMVKTLLLQGQLPPTIKQMILVAISTQNDCQYCKVAHTRALGALGVSREVIDDVTTNLDLAKVPPQQRAVLQFALKAAQVPKGMTDADFAQLHDFGFNDGEIMEIAMLASFANFINTWADISGIEIDEESA